MIYSKDVHEQLVGLRNRPVCCLFAPGLLWCSRASISPLLLDVDLLYLDNAVDFLTKTQHSQLFNGSEIVVSGQMTNNDPENFLEEVFAKGVRTGH